MTLRNYCNAGEFPFSTIPAEFSLGTLAFAVGGGLQSAHFNHVAQLPPQLARVIRVKFRGQKKLLELPEKCIVEHCFKPRHQGEKRCKAHLRARNKELRRACVPDQMMG